MVADDGGRRRWTVVKVNEEIINWCGVRIIVVKRYKIAEKN